MPETTATRKTSKENEREIKINVFEFFHILIFSFLLLSLFKQWHSTLYTSFEGQETFLAKEQKKR